MSDAAMALVGVLSAASLGTIGGYLVARQQGRQALELAELTARAEQQRQLRQLAVEITKIELERNPKNPHMAGEHVAVLMGLLVGLGVVEGGSGAPSGEAVAHFRAMYCMNCGSPTCCGCGEAAMLLPSRMDGERPR